MWPFRRRLSVSSPELVSAVPISQDGIIIAHDANVQRALTQQGSSQEKVTNWSTTSPPSSTTSSARKSISTWGRKVGKKWDEIKRSDSSELLSVSGRRRHWSPNRKTVNDVSDDSPQSSATNFLKPKRVLRVKSLRHLFRHGEKGLNGSTTDDSKSATIQEEESCTDYKLDKSFSEGVIRLPSSFKNHMPHETLNNRKRIFSRSVHDIDKRQEMDYFLANTGTIKPKIETDITKPVLRKKQEKSESVTDLTKNTFNVPSDNKERNEQRKSIISNGLEELVNNMKIGCDESGYDSDSTRTGADSPDCEKLNLKTRSYSITSEDLRALELAMAKNDQNEVKSQPIELIIDTNPTDFDKQRNEDADSTEHNLDATLRADDNDLDKTLDANANCSNKIVRFDLQESLLQTPKKKLPSFRLNDTKTLRKKCKSRDIATVGLLDETASPCKDTPPIHKVLNSGSPTVTYCTPKRPRVNLDSSFHEPEIEQAFKRPAVDYDSMRKEDSKPSLFKIEYKMLKLNVRPGSLGISIAEKENGRPGYVISRLDPKGEAAKSGLFRMGDEVIRVCGKRFKRISLLDARNVLQNCSGQVEIYIGRQPSMFNFTEERPFEWPESSSNTSSVTTDEDIWSRKDPKPMDTSCEIVGFLKKDGKFLSVDNFGETDEPVEKVTGMKKFHVRKRVSNVALHSRRAISLSMDTLSIVLEKGAGKKKLGFTIVGGSDSEKGNFGIYVKNIIPDGQAASCLRTGDEILAINGVSMDGLTHAQALQAFKATKPGEMIVHVRRRDSAHLKRLHR